MHCCRYLPRVASFNLDEFETSQAAFEAAAALDPNVKAVKGWLAKCEKELSCAPFLTSQQHLT